MNARAHTYASRARLRLWLALVAALLGLLAVPSVATAVTVSGIAVRDDTGVVWQGCANGGASIGIAVGSTKVANVGCDPATGAFSATGITIPAVNTLVTAYFDGVSTRGVSYTLSKDTTSNISSHVLMQKDVSLQSERTAYQVDSNMFTAYQTAQDPDIPAASSGNVIVTEPGFGTHFRGDDIFYVRWATDALDVMGTATYRSPVAGILTVRAPGTAGCMFGPGVQRPLCMRPGAGYLGDGDSGVRYVIPSGEYEIESLNYDQLWIEGGPTSLGILGTGPGQSMNINYNIRVSSPISSDPWGPNMQLGSFSSARWNSVGSTWTGRARFNLTVGNNFGGFGTVDLPGAVVTARPNSPRFSFGPSLNLQTWRFGTVVLGNGGYTRSPWGTLGSSGAIDGGADDVDVAHYDLFNQSNPYAILQLGNDIGVVSYAAGSATPNADYDDQDLNGVDNDGDALLRLDNAGAVDVARLSWFNEHWTPTIAGSSGGDWALWSLDNHGRPNTAFNGTGFAAWDGGGASDEIRTVQNLGSNNFRFWGTAGATPGIRARDFNTVTGVWTDHVAQWNHGGLPTEMRATCHSWIFGVVGTSPNRDIVARRLNGAGVWDGTAPVVVDLGGDDDIVGCANGYIAGTTGTGPARDGKLIRWEYNGRVMSFGTGGVVTLPELGDDVVTGLRQDLYGAGALVAATSPGNGGRAHIYRYDQGGDRDMSFGTGGVITWDDTAGAESITSMFDNNGNYLLVAGSIGNAPTRDGIVRRYDAAGDLTSTATPGRIVFPLHAGTLETTDGFAAGLDTDPGSSVIDLQTHDATVTASGSVTQAADGYLRGSRSSLLTASTMDFEGEVDPGFGRMRLRSTRRDSRLDMSALSKFHRLTIEGNDTNLAVDPASPVRIDDDLSLSGASCAAPIRMTSETPGTPWTLALQPAATRSIMNVNLTDSVAAPTALTTASGLDGGGNSGWTIAGCGAPATPDAPTDAQVDGVVHASHVDHEYPVLSWRNRVGSVDRADVEVLSSPREHEVARWKFDGDGSDDSGNGRTLTAGGTAGYTAVGGGKFQQAATIAAGAGNRFTTPSDPAFDLPEFTIDAWIRSDGTGTATNDVIIQRCATRCAFRMHIQNNNDMRAGFQSADGAWVESVFAFGAFLDNQWHHVAYTWDGSRGWVVVDGVLRSSVIPVTPQPPAVVVAPVEVGTEFGGALDDMRILRRASTVAEIAGYFRTNRRHAEEIWDFDPADATGTALGATYGLNARVPVTYAGAADSLLVHGARYWVRSRLRTTGGTMSAWSDEDWFETRQHITVAVDQSEQNVNLSGSGVISGDQVTSQFTIDATTRNARGYQLSVRGPSNTWAMSNGIAGAQNEIPGWGSNTTPSLWPAGAGPAFGLAVLSGTGGKDTARWGTGTDQLDPTTVKYSWPSLSTPLVLHSRAVYDPNPQEVVVGIRAKTDALTNPGNYATTLVVTGVANP